MRDLLFKILLAFLNLLILFLLAGAAGPACLNQEIKDADEKIVSEDIFSFNCKIKIESSFALYDLLLIEEDNYKAKSIGGWAETYRLDGNLLKINTLFSGWQDYLIITDNMIYQKGVGGWYEYLKFENEIAYLKGINGWFEYLKFEDSMVKKRALNGWFDYMRTLGNSFQRNTFFGWQNYLRTEGDNCPDMKTLFKLNIIQKLEEEEEEDQKEDQEDDF